jgi:four helix bundle protein
MNADEIKRRTQIFAISIIRFVQNLPNQGSTNILGRQLLSCGTSVGANYRAACRAKSRADFIAKLKIVEEECDESIYWMELLTAMQLGSAALIAALIKEANQILSIVVASIRTARTSIPNPKFVNRQS